MARDINLNSPGWLELVFAGKNQKYGAYYLRQTSDKRHIRAILLMLAIAACIVLIPLLVKSVIPKTVPFTSSDIVKMTAVDLGMPEDDMTDAPEEVFLAPVEQVIPTTSTIAYVVPEIDPTVENDDEVLTNKEITESTRQVFESTNEGTTDDPTATPPRGGELTGGAENIPTTPKPPIIIDYADVSPSFPGGPGAMMEYLNSNIAYPSIAAQNGIKGRVTVRFAVMEDGSISRISIAKGVHSSLDAEAERLVRGMPRWVPGLQNGKPVSVFYTVTVNFRLEN